MILFACKECTKTYDMSEIAQDEGGPTPGAYRCPVNRDHQLFMSLAPQPPIAFDTVPSLRPTILSVEVAPFLERAADNPLFETEYDGHVESVCYWCDEVIDRNQTHKPDCLHLKAKTLLGR